MKRQITQITAIALFTLSLMTVFINEDAFAQSKMYWTDTHSNTIQRANLDGSSVETVVNGVTASLDMAIDQINGKIYWVDIGQFVSGFGDEVIRRANLDGTGVETILTTADGLRAPWAIEVDPNGGKVYWADGNTQKIYRADLNGQNIELIVDIPKFRSPDFGSGTAVQQITEFGNVGGLALDIANNQLYWTDYFGGDIHRTSMDGAVDITQIERLVSGLTTPRGIVLDDVDGRMYWVTGRFGSEVMRAYTDGSGVEVLVGKKLGTRLKQPFRIGLDVVAGLMYWTDRDTGLIQQADFDGANVTTLLTLEYQKKPGDFRPSSPTGLALDLVGDTVAGTLPAPTPTPGVDVSGAPDLLGTMDKLRVNNKNGNDQLEFQFSVQNNGTAALTGSYTIKAFLSVDDIPDQADTLLESWTAQGLGTGAVQRFKSRLDLSGSHVNENVVIVIDADNSIVELDEGNNLIIGQILP